MAENVAEFAHAVRMAIHIDCDMIHIAEVQARFAQAISDRLRRKPRPMLDAPKTLFFRGRHQHTVLHQSRRRIGVEGVDTENNHKLLACDQLDSRSSRELESPGETGLHE